MNKSTIISGVIVLVVGLIVGFGVWQLASDNSAKEAAPVDPFITGGQSDDEFAAEAIGPNEAPLFDNPAAVECYANQIAQHSPAAREDWTPDENAYTTAGWALACKDERDPLEWVQKWYLGDEIPAGCARDWWDGQEEATQKGLIAAAWYLVPADAGGGGQENLESDDAAPMRTAARSLYDACA